MVTVSLTVIYHVDWRVLSLCFSLGLCLHLGKSDLISSNELGPVELFNLGLLARWVANGRIEDVTG